MTSDERVVVESALSTLLAFPSAAPRHTSSNDKRLVLISHAEALPYRARLQELLMLLVRQGSLGVFLVDLSHLSQVERVYGSKAFEKVLGSSWDLIMKLQGSEIRADDILATSDQGDDCFLVFLSPRRSEKPARLSRLQTAASRIEDKLNVNLGRHATKYLRQRPNVTVGYAMILNNPLVKPERLLARLVEDARECVRYKRMHRQFQMRFRLQEILINEDIKTVFQPIVELGSERTLGYEALSRGPKGDLLQSPLNLFDSAIELDLVFELDRLCRQRALTNARDLPEAAKLFVNVMPPTLFDPDFQGANLIQSLDELNISPTQVVFELTEKLAIENYGLFADAIRNFTQMGFSIAVDDIGAGYSGLEKITHLHPRYLKFDIDLIRGIDTSFVRREIVSALKSLADKMDSTIIAEGIERQEEYDTLLELGIELGQGYLLGRPVTFFGRQTKASSSGDTEDGEEILVPIELGEVAAPERARS